MANKVMKDIKNGQLYMAIVCDSKTLIHSRIDFSVFILVCGKQFLPVTRKIFVFVEIILAWKKN